MTKAEKKKYLQLWQQFRDNSYRSTPIDLNESELDKKKRVAKLEKNPEKWFAYYFPEFYTESLPIFIKGQPNVYWKIQNITKFAVGHVNWQVHPDMMEVLLPDTLPGKRKNGV